MKAIVKNTHVANHIGTLENSSEPLDNIMGQMIQTTTHDSVSIPVGQAYKNLNASEVYEALVADGIMTYETVEITKYEKRYKVNELYKQYFVRAATGYRLNINTLAEAKEQFLDDAVAKLESRKKAAGMGGRR